MQKIQLKNTASAVLLIIGLLVLGMELPARIAVATSESVIHRIFFIDGREPLDFSQGDYIMIDYPASTYTENKPVQVIKTVGCDQGHHLKVEYNQYYCDSKFLGTAKAETRTGKQLTAFQYDGKVPEGKFFAAGQHKDSFDSRYIGFLERKNVKTKLLPLY